MPSPGAGIPANSSVIMPRLFCKDPDAAIDFYVRGLGASELRRRPGPDGRTAHALLTLGPAMFMVEAEWSSLPSRAPNPDGSSPVVIFVYVQDVDGLVQRAVASGARVLIPATNQFWGDRTAWIIDPAGHVWTVASRIEETTEAERDTRWSHILADQQRSAGETTPAAITDPVTLSKSAPAALPGVDAPRSALARLGTRRAFSPLTSRALCGTERSDL